MTALPPPLQAALASPGASPGAVELFRAQLAAVEDIRPVYVALKGVVGHLVGNRQFSAAALSRLARIVWAIIPDQETHCERRRVLKYCTKLIRFVCAMTSARLAAQRSAALAVLANIPYSLDAVREMKGAIVSVDEALEACCSDKSVVVRREATLIKQSLTKLNLVDRDAISPRVYMELLNILLKHTTEGEFINGVFKTTKKEEHDKEDLDIKDVIKTVNNMAVNDISSKSIKALCKYVKKSIDSIFMSEEEKPPTAETFLNFLVEYYKVTADYFEKTKVITILYKICTVLVPELSQTGSVEYYYSHIFLGIKYILDRKPSDYMKALELIKMGNAFGKFILSLHYHFSTQISQAIVEPFITALRGNDSVLTSEKLSALAVFTSLFSIRGSVVPEYRSLARKQCLRIMNESSRTPDAIMKKAAGSSAIHNRASPLHLCCSALVVIFLSYEHTAKLETLKHVSNTLLEPSLLDDLSVVPNYNDIMRACPFVALLAIHEIVDMLNDYNRDSGRNEEQGMEEGEKEKEKTTVRMEIYQSITDIFQKFYMLVCCIIGKNSEDTSYNDVLLIISSISFAVIVSLLLDEEKQQKTRIHESEDVIQQKLQLYCTVLFIQGLLSRISLWKDSNTIRNMAMRTSIVRSVLTKKLWKNKGAFAIGLASAFIWAYYPDIAIGDEITGIGDGEGWGLVTLICFLKQGIRVDKLTTLRLLSMPYPETHLTLWARRELQKYISKDSKEVKICKEAVEVISKWELPKSDSDSSIMKKDATSGNKVTFQCPDQGEENVEEEEEEEEEAILVPSETISFALKLSEMLKNLYDNVASQYDEEQDESDYEEEEDD